MINEFVGAVVLGVGGVVSITLILLGFKILNDPNWERKRQDCLKQIKETREMIQFLNELNK